MIVGFDAAESKCASLQWSAHLASIHSQEEQDWILGNFNKIKMHLTEVTELR